MSGVGVEASKMDKQRWENFLSYLERPQRGQLGATSNANSTTAIDLVNDSHDGSSTAIENDLTAETEADLLKRRRLGETENVVVLSSDSENDDETIWSSYAKCKDYKRLWDKARCLVFYRLIPKYYHGTSVSTESYLMKTTDEQIFPYNKLKNLAEDLRKFQQDFTHNEEELNFLWNNVLQWLLAINQSLYPVDAKYDEKFNLILIEFMVQYVNYITNTFSNYPNEETIRENIQKVVQTLTVILSENTFYALMVLLRIELKLEYRGILDPIFRKYLTDPSLCHASSDLVVYLQLIFCFKRWKTITPLKTDRESINDLAVGKSSRKQNGKAGSEATDLTTESILPKSVPRVNENNKFFVSISDLIGFAIERKAFGTRILLVYTSLDLEDAIAKFLQMYVRYVSCNPGLGIPEAPTPPTRDSTDILKRPFKEIDRMTYSKKMDAPLRQQKQERKEQHSTNQPNQKATKLERNTKSSSKTSHITHFEKICDKNKFRPSNPSSCNISNISHSHNTNTQSDISLSSSMMMSGSVRKNTEFMQINLIDSDDEGRVETNKLKQSPKITKVSDLNKIDANGSNTSNSQQQETQKVKTHKRFVRRQRDKKQKESQLQGTDSKTNTKHSEETIVLTSTSSSSSSSDDENCLVKHPRNSDSDTVGRQTNSSSSIANETNTLALAEQSLPRIAAIPPRCRPLVESVATKPTRKEKHCIPGEVSSTTSPDCAPQTNRTQSVQEAQEKETSLSSFQYNVSNLEVHSAGTLQNAREVGIVKAVQQRISPCPPVVVSGTCKPGSLLLGIDYSDFSSDNEDLESEFGAHLLSQGSWKIVEEATSSTAEIPKTMTENIASSTRSERSRVKSRGNSLEKMCLLRNASKEKFDSEHSQSLEGTGNSKELVDRPTYSKYVETSSTLSTISQKGSNNRIKKGEIVNENETNGSETMLVSLKQTQLLEPNCIKNSIEESNIEGRGESRKTYLEKIDLLKEGDQTASSTNSGGNKSYNTTEDIEKSLEKIDNVEAELIKTKETQAKYRTTNSLAALEKNLENSDILKKTEATEKPNMQMIVQETSPLNRPNENKCNTGASNVTTENIIAVETVVFAKLAEADKSFRASESIEAADIESLLKEIDENLNENNVFQNTKNKLNDDKGLEVATFDSKECDVEITHSSISDVKEPESCLSANIKRKEIEDSLNKVHCNADIISKDKKKSEIQFKTKHSETKGEIKKQQKEPERISNDNTNRSDTNRSPDEKFKGNVLSEKVDLEIDDRETKSELTIIDFVISTKNSTESVDHGEHNEPKPIEYNSSLDVEDNVDYSKPDIVSDISTKLDYNEKSKKEKTILEKKTEEAIKKLAEEIEEEIEEKIKNQPIHSKLNVKCPKAIEDQDLICGDKSASEHLKPRIHERKALDSNVKNSTTDIEAINESECKQDEIVNEPSKDCLSEVPENTGFSCANSVHETISKAEKSQSESRAKNAAQICLKDNEKIILPQSDFVDLNISENKLTNDDMGSEDNAAENSTETMTKLVKPLELISNTNTYEQEERSSQDCAIDEVSQIGQNEVIGVTSEDKNIVELVGNETEKVKTSELSKSCIDLVLEKKEELIVTDKKTVEFETETQVTSPNSQLDLVKKASASNKTVPKIIDERLGETQSETLDKDNSNSTQDNKIKPAMSSVNREKEEQLEAENSAKKSAETSSLHYDQKYQEKTQTEEETLLERSKQIKEDNKKQSEEISTENNKAAIEHTFSQEIKNHEDLEGMNKISEETFGQHACLEIHKETPTNFVEIDLKDDVNTHQKVKAVISDNKKEESCEAKKSEIISADTSKELPNLINHKVLLSNVVDKVKIIDDTKNDHIEQLVDKSNDNNSLSNLISGENKEEEENQEATSLTMVEKVKLKNATKKDKIKQPVQKSKNDGLIAISAIKKRKLHSEIKNAVTMPDETSCFTVENREVIQPYFAEEVKRKDIKQGKTKLTVEESNDNSTKVISGENQEKEEESAELSISEENQQKEGHNETENITTHNEKITPSTLAEKVKLKDVVKEKDQIDKPVQNSNYKLSAISDGNLEKAEYLEVEISSKISDKISSGHSSIDKDQLTSLPSLEKQKFTDETPIEHQNPEKQLLITPSVLVEYPKLSNGSRSDKPRKEKYGKVPKRSQAIKKENGQETSKRPKSSSEVPSIETSKESFDRDDSHTSKKTFETGEKICDDTSKLAYDDVDSISSPTKQRSVKENVDKRTSGKVRIKRRIGLCSDINKEFNSESKDAQMGLLDSISQKTRKNIDIAKETDELVLNISRLKIANYKTDSESDDSQEESDVGDLKKVLLGNLGLKRTRSNLESEIELKNSENNKDIADIMQGRRKKQKIVKHTLKKSSLLPEPLELMPSNYNNEELAAVTALINMQKQCALTTGEKSNDLSANVKDDNLEETTDTSRLSGTGKVKVQLKKYSPQEDHTSGSTVAVTSIKPILKSALKSCDGSIKEKVMKKVQYDEASLLLLKKHSEIRQGKKAFQNLKKTRSEEGALLKGGNKLLKKRLAEINARFDREYMTDVKDVQEVSPSFETESIIKTTKGQRKKIKISDPLTVSSRKELENTVSKLAERIKHLHTNDELSNRSTFERCTPILQHTVEIPKPRRGRKKRAPQESEIEEDEPASLVETSTNKISEINSEKIGVNPVCPISKECTEIQNESTNSESSISILPASIEVPKQILSKDKITGAEDNSVLPNVGDEPKLVEKLLVERNVTPCDSDLKQKEKDQNEKNDVNSMQEIETESSIDANSTVKSRNELSLIKENDKQQGIEKCNKMKKAFVKIKRVSIPMQTAIVSEIVSNKAVLLNSILEDCPIKKEPIDDTQSTSPSPSAIDIEIKEEEEESLDTDKFTQMQNDFSFPEDPAGVTKAHTFKEIIVRPCDVILTADIINAQAVRIKEIAREKRKIKRILRTRSLLRKGVAKNVNVESGLKSLPKRLKKSVVFSKPMEFRKEPAIASENRQINNDTISINNANNILSSNILKLTDAARTEVTIATKTNDNDVNANKKKGEETLLEKKTSLVRKESNKLDEMILTKDSKVNLTPDEKDRPSQNFCKTKEKEMFDSLSTPENEVNDLNQKKEQNYSKPKKCASKQELITMGDGIVPGKLIKSKTKEVVHDKDTSVVKEKITDLPVNVNEVINCESMNASNKDSKIIEPCESKKTIISAKDSEVKLISEEENEPSDTCTKQEKESTESRSPRTNEIKDLNQNKKTKKR